MEMLPKLLTRHSKYYQQSYKYQRDSAVSFVNKDVSVLSWEMGLGKTRGAFLSMLYLFFHDIIYNNSPSTSRNFIYIVPENLLNGLVDETSELKQAILDLGSNVVIITNNKSIKAQALVTDFSKDVQEAFHDVDLTRYTFTLYIYASKSKDLLAPKVLSEEFLCGVFDEYHTFTTLSSDISITAESSRSSNDINQKNLPKLLSPKHILYTTATPFKNSVEGLVSAIDAYTNGSFPPLLKEKVASAIKKYSEQKYARSPVNLEENTVSMGIFRSASDILRPIIDIKTYSDLINTDVFTLKPFSPTAKSKYFYEILSKPPANFYPPTESTTTSPSSRDTDSFGLSTDIMRSQNMFKACLLNAGSDDILRSIKSFLSFMKDEDPWDSKIDDDALALSMNDDLDFLDSPLGLRYIYRRLGLYQGDKVCKVSKLFRVVDDKLDYDVESLDSMSSYKLSASRELVFHKTFINALEHWGTLLENSPCEQISDKETLESLVRMCAFVNPDCKIDEYKDIVATKTRLDTAFSFNDKASDIANYRTLYVILKNADIVDQAKKAQFMNNLSEILKHVAMVSSPLCAHLFTESWCKYCESLDDAEMKKQWTDAVKFIVGNGILPNEYVKKNHSLRKLIDEEDFPAYLSSSIFTYPDYTVIPPRVLLRSSEIAKRIRTDSNAQFWMLRVLNARENVLLELTGRSEYKKLIDKVLNYNKASEDKPFDVYETLNEVNQMSPFRGMIIFSSNFNVKNSDTQKTVGNHKLDELLEKAMYTSLRELGMVDDNYRKFYSFTYTKTQSAASGIYKFYQCAQIHYFIQSLLGYPPSVYAINTLISSMSVGFNLPNWRFTYFSNAADNISDTLQASGRSFRSTSLFNSYVFVEAFSSNWDHMVFLRSNSWNRLASNLIAPRISDMKDSLAYPFNNTAMLVPDKTPIPFIKQNSCPPKCNPYPIVFKCRVDNVDNMPDIRVSDPLQGLVFKYEQLKSEYDNIPKTVAKDNTVCVSYVDPVSKQTCEHRFIFPLFIYNNIACTGSLFLPSICSNPYGNTNAMMKRFILKHFVANMQLPISAEAILNGSVNYRSAHLTSGFTNGDDLDELIIILWSKRLASEDISRENIKGLKQSNTPFSIYTKFLPVTINDARTKKQFTKKIF